MAATLSSIFSEGHMFQLQSDMLLCHNLRCYQSYFGGGLDSNRIKPSDHSALHVKLEEDQQLFNAVTKWNPNVVSAILDTGTSHNVLTDKSLFDPKSLVQLSQPVELDGIAGGQLLQCKGVTNLEVVTNTGETHPIKMEAFLSEQFPCTLLSPRSMLAATEQAKAMKPDGTVDEELLQSLVEDHFSVHKDRIEWNVDGSPLLTMAYDSTFLPRLTLFPEGKSEATLKSMLSTLHTSNKNLTPLQKVWQLWHNRLGHPAHSLVQKIAAGGCLGPAALNLSKLPLTDKPMCPSCPYGRQVACPTKTTVTKKVPDKVGSLKVDQTVPGVTIFSDQSHSLVPGRLFHTAGRESNDDKFCGSTLFVDAASGHICVAHQVTFNASDTINAKVAFE